jgi:uncharacterized protein YacL
LSARPFWVIFTICMIVLMEWLVIAPIIDWRLDKDIAESISYQQANEVISESRAVPKEIKAWYARKAEIDGESTIRLQDITGLEFRTRWDILYESSKTKAFLVPLALIIMGMLAGGLIANIAFRNLVTLEDRLSEMSTMDKVAVFFGFLIGLLISGIFIPTVMNLLHLPDNPMVTAVLGILVTYLCVAAAMSMKEDLKLYFPSLSKGSNIDIAFQKPKILDTNVIIDGRIYDICQAGFVEGQIYVPSFVLEELQHIADSSDSLRRARGRRGLDILNQMRKEIDVSIRAYDSVDPDNPEEVDTRLVKMAKDLDGCIITNDFNLNKVAEFQGVPVLNVNELANALKPVVLPGEEMTVSIIKEGKEISQGIAYLDDGTMIVVEGARSHIGETMDVIVTSVLQTVAGKMIFANLKAVQAQEDDIIDRNVRNYSGFRPRKKT